MGTKKETTNWAEKLPLEPPAALWEYKPLKEALDGDAIVFKSGWVFEPLEDRRVQMAECHCTACGETYYLDYIRGHSCNGVDKRGIQLPEGEVFYSGDKCCCPQCEQSARVTHVSEFGNRHTYMLSRTFAMNFQQIDGHFAILTWKIERHTDKYGRTIRNALPYEAYVCDGRKMVKAAGYQKNYFSTTQLYRWAQRSRCDDTWRANERYPVLPLSAEVLRGTEAENSKLDIYLKKHPQGYPVSYLQVYLKHNNVENLITKGMDDLVHELLDQCVAHAAYYNSYGIHKDLRDIDWKKKRPSEMLGMTGQELESFMQSRYKLEELDKIALLKKHHVIFKIEDLALLKAYSNWEIESIFEFETNVMKAVRYLERQKRKYPKDHVSATSLRDYWRIKEKLGEEEDRYPQRLEHAHDQAYKEFDRRKNAIAKKQMRERYDLLMKYAFEANGLLIRPAKNATEFKKEGETLHHCVRTYINSHAEGKTAIFFIRKIDAPEEPFFTLELDEKSLTVRQNRGLRNCNRTPEVKAFEEKWLDHLKGLRKKEKDGHGKSKQHGAGATAA